MNESRVDIGDAHVAALYAWLGWLEATGWPAPRWAREALYATRLLDVWAEIAVG